MAKNLSKSGITTGNTVKAGHVTQSIDAFTGVEAYDLTLSGSLVVTGSITGQPGVINQLTASYAVQALTEITKEVSSSHANFADTASFALGLSGTPSITTSLVTTTNLITTNLTASGNISSSGTIIASNLSGTNTGDQNISNLAVTGSDVIFNHITASGNISSSGNISCNRINSGVVTSTELSLNEIVYTGLESSLRGNAAFIFNEGTGTLSVNKITNVDTTHITASGNISSSGTITSDAITIKDTTGDSALTIEGTGRTEINLFTTHASTNRDVGINLSASSNGQEYSLALDRANDTFVIAASNINNAPANKIFELNAGGTISNILTTHVTASGNISASGDIIGVTGSLDHVKLGSSTFLEFHSPDDVSSTTFPIIQIGTPFTNLFTLDTLGDAVFGSSISATGGNVILQNSANNAFLNVKGHITASGNISSSGILTGEGLVISDDANITDTLTVGTIANVNTTHITASGNISSSGTVTGVTGSFSHLVGNSPITISDQTTFTLPITASGGFSGEATNIYRPIITVGTNPFTASADTAGGYYRMGGNVTCSIILNATASCPIGSEFEFFQTSSVGYVLFETGSAGITLNSKSGNMKLAGQFSAATLKKIGSDEWDLIGDLG